MLTWSEVLTLGIGVLLCGEKNHYKRHDLNVQTKKKNSYIGAPCTVKLKQFFQHVDIRHKSYR